MKTIQPKTTWSRRIGFYLLSLAVLALFGWSEGAIWLAAFAGGIALLIWWVAGLGWVAVTDAKELGRINEDLSDELLLNPSNSFLLGNAYHHDDD